LQGQRYTSTEMLAALYATVWGLFIANPYIDSFSRNPGLYKPMLQIIPYEFVWGLIAAGAGVVAVVFILQNKMQSAAVANLIVFSAFALLFLFSDLSSPAFILFGLIAAFNFIHWRVTKWRTSQNISNG
jgi:hypothetical protein